MMDDLCRGAVGDDTSRYPAAIINYHKLTGILNEHPRAAIACRESENRDKYTESYERLLEKVIDE